MARRVVGRSHKDCTYARGRASIEVRLIDG
jgi:hypothetical protein